MEIIVNATLNNITICPIKNKRRRLKLCERCLPNYTRGEEIFNMVSHIVGGGLGVVTLALCVIISALKGNSLGIICGAVFGISMIALYAMSSIYHGLPHGTAKKVFQIFDHCTIYFLIVGTYTPTLLCCLAELYPVRAYVTLAAVWGLTVLSVTLTAIDIEKYKTLSMTAYLGLGWAIIFSITHIFEALGTVGFSLLLGGGILYTAGVLFFKAGKNKKYCHSVFHLFVLAGSLTHALCVILFVM